MQTLFDKSSWMIMYWHYSVHLSFGRFVRRWQTRSSPTLYDKPVKHWLIAKQGKQGLPGVFWLDGRPKIDPVNSSDFFLCWSPVKSPGVWRPFSASKTSAWLRGVNPAVLDVCGVGVCGNCFPMAPELLAVKFLMNCVWPKFEDFERGWLEDGGLASGSRLPAHPHLHYPNDKACNLYCCVCNWVRQSLFHLFHAWVVS